MNKVAFHFDYTHTKVTKITKYCFCDTPGWYKMHRGTLGDQLFKVIKEEGKNPKNIKLVDWIKLFMCVVSLLVFFSPSNKISNPWSFVKDSFYRNSWKWAESAVKYSETKKVKVLNYKF